MRRLFPVPYRFLSDDKKFGKWMWIRARVSKASRDRRPESYKVDVDSIAILGKRISTKDNWGERRQWVEPHTVGSFSELETRRQRTGETLGFVRPSRLLALDIEPVRHPEWTEDEKEKLVRDGLFDESAARSRALLRKLPYDFYYRYECATAAGAEQHRHKITDWEAGALYWNCHREYGRGWESKFRQRLETVLAEKDLHFLLGTIHRFPDKWLIVGVFYPPKQPTGQPEQLELELGR
jgi:hypothetical protein